PEPAMMEVGVAKPSAHGQAITRIEIVGISDAPKSHGVTAKYQIMKVTSATPTTIGTNTLEILSAIRRISAFDPCASSTNLTICAKAEFFPTFVAVTFSDPLLL